MGIFNIDPEFAVRLEIVKLEARSVGKKLDVDSVVDNAPEKFLKKAEKKFEELGLEDGSQLYVGDNFEGEVTETDESMNEISRNKSSMDANQGERLIKCQFR